MTYSQYWAKSHRYLRHNYSHYTLHTSLSIKEKQLKTGWGYNIILSGLRQDQVRKLQYVQNSAARLLTGSRKHEHITPVLRDLHWLPVHERIRFKILLMTLNVLID